MNFYGIDASTKTGFAYVQMRDNEPHLIESMVFTAPNHKGINRALWLADCIINHMDPPDAVGGLMMENYSYQSINRLVEMVEIGTIIRHRAMEAGYKINLAAPSCLKKFVCMNGNADKKRMILEAHKRWGFDLSDDNQCDAACLAVMAAAYNGKYLGLPKIAVESLGVVTLCS